MELADFFEEDALELNFDETAGEECDHAEVETGDDGVSVCKGCKCVIDNLDFQQEWRYYGTSDNKSSKNPSRCHRPKNTKTGNIDGVFAADPHLSIIPAPIRKATEQKYKMVVGNKTVRGKKRKAIIAACLMYVYRERNENRTSDSVRKMFGISKKDMSDGVTRYLSAFPEARTEHITIKALLSDIVTKVGIDRSHYQKIFSIAELVEHTDSIVKRSNPVSVASSVVYFYICITPSLATELGLTKPEYSAKVGLSEITITKLVKKISEVLEIKLPE